MPIVLAAPAAPPDAVRLSARPMSWTGADGSKWELSAPFSFPAMGRGVTGLHMPRFNVHESSTPLVPGVELTGYSLPGRAVYWPLVFDSKDNQSWAVRHGAFFDSFHPVETGTWTVGEGPSARSIELTGVFDGSHSFDADPFVSGFSLVGVELFAPRPLWEGASIRRTFRAAAGAPFIDAVDLAPTFYVSPAASFATAQIENPGNEPAYLKWVVEGPQDELRLGVAGATIEVPFPVAEGSTLVIDTDPAAQYATLDGVDCTPALGFQIFGPVPARGTSPLTIVSSGSGSVTAELTPLFWRAF